MIIKKFIFRFLALAIFLFIGTPAFAGTISVTPLFIDYTTEARDIKEEVIKIKNHGGTPVRMYASVNEISLDNDGQIKEFVTPSMTDRKTSVTSWIEISRGRNAIPPGGEIEIPFTIRINPNAAPGKYQVFIGFANGKNRNIAEEQIMAGKGDGVIVRITIDEKQSEFMRLISFITDRFMLNRGDQKLSYEVENTGDVNLKPSGEVIFYDSRGRELSSISLNENGKEIRPGETVIFDESVPDFDGIGRNKAFMTLEYGVKNKAAVYDTVYFYSMPIPYLVGILLVFLLIVFSGTVAVYKISHRRPSESNHDDVHEVAMYVRDGHHERDEKDHDLNLKSKQQDE